MNETREETLAAEVAAPDSRGFLARLAAALRLEPALYEEVEHDPGALGHATGVVALAGLASGLAAADTLGAGAVVAGIAAAFLGWVLSTAIVWSIGVKVFHHTSDFEELLRTLGFVAAPQVLYAIAIFPLGWLETVLGVVVAILTLIAFFRAVRRALDVDVGRALFVSALSVVAYLGVALLLVAALT